MTTPGGEPQSQHRTGRWRIAAVALGVVLVVGGGVAVATASDDGARTAATTTSTTTGPTSTGSRAGMAGTPVGTSDVCGDVPGAMQMDDGMVMAGVPDRAPTATDRRNAATLVRRVTDGLGRYASLPAAVADGYVPATNPNGYVVHYADWDTVRRGDVLDVTHPSSLVYANTFKGPVLIGAMFMGPGPCRPGPDVAGPLTQWHAHDNLCLSAALQVVGRTGSGGTCATGRHNTATFFMLHVWTAPTLAADHQFEAHLPRAPVAAIIRTGRG
jgi:hypothetical protein